MKIYVVAPKVQVAGQPESSRLVRAKNQSQALRHVADELSVAMASQEDMARLIKAGVEIEDLRDANPSTN